jgi:polysaccharide export outer membrane protein
MNKIPLATRATASVFGLILATLVPLAAQTRQQTTGRPSTQTAPEVVTSPTVVVSAEEDYRIGPRDVIEIKIDDADELSRTYEIAADGTFLMSYVQRIKAEGRTPDELARFIEDKLRGGYLKDPHVSVYVRQFNSHTFFVQGSVARPGAYQIEGRPSLFKLLTVAGGLLDNSGTAAFIFRPLKGKQSASTDAQSPGQPSSAGNDAEPDPTEEYTVKAVNIVGLMKGRLDQNVFLEAGDTVSIPKADVFFVTGEVKSPGGFPLGDGTTLRQAIALSQGTTLNAKGGDTIIMRTDSSGKRVEIKADLPAIMKNRADDIVLEANDVVIVPNSRGKSVMNTFLKAFGVGVVQRGVY